MGFTGLQRKVDGSKVRIKLSWLDKKLILHTFVPYTMGQTVGDIIFHAIANIKEGSIYEYGKFTKYATMSYVLENRDGTDHRVFDVSEVDDITTSISIL